MRTLSDETIAPLLAPHRPPCISLYMPTHRAYPGTQQNPILYKDLLRQVEQALAKYPHEARGLLEPLGALVEDVTFWTHRLDGLALFHSADGFHRFDLQQTVPARVVVGDSFHLKPLLRLWRTQDRYQVLGLSRARVRLYEGDRDHLDEIDLDGVPATPDEALGEQVGNARENQPRPHPGIHPAGKPHAHGGHHGEQAGGHPSKGEEAKLEGEHFFEVVDKEVWQRHSRPSGLPLVLAALPVNQQPFRAHSHNSQLLPEGIEKDPEAMSVAQLRQAAWQIVAPRHGERLARQVEAFEVARARGQASADLAEVARAAFLGRVGTLLLDANRHLPGRLDPSDGHPVPGGDGNGAGVEDVYDDLGELVLRQSGTVLVVPGERIPTDTGLAAIFRY
jgi:hypothetical protein